MDNNIIKKEIDGVIVITINYETIGTVNGTEINKIIHSLIKANKTKVVLDLLKVLNANSFGLSLFFRIKNSLKENGGDLVIININTRLQGLLKTAGLLDYFEIMDNEKDAIDFLNK